MTTTSSLFPGGPVPGAGRPLPPDTHPRVHPGASVDVAGALVRRELRCLMNPVRMDHDVGQPVNGWRWTTDNSWSPIPDQWFASPEEALERFWEAAT